MTERYKVLGAMLALGDFTVPELVQYSGVNQQTVRTVLVRERRSLKALGAEKGGGRGGRFKRFQVRPEQIEEIRQELNELYRSLAPIRPALAVGVEQSQDRDSVPVAILAAEDTLLRRFPEAQEIAERKRLLKLAEKVWLRYSLQIKEEGSDITRLHLESLDGLQKLCSAELAASYEPFFSRLAFDRAKESLRGVAAQFKHAGHAEHATELLDRALASDVTSPPAEVVRAKAQEMIAALKHPEVYVREVSVQAAAAAASAGDTLNQLASNLISRLRSDTDPIVRRTAAEVLGELKHWDAVVMQALATAAEEDEPSVQSAARKSLAILEAQSAERSVEQASDQAFETA